MILYLETARRRFDRDRERITVVELTAEVCDAAARLAEPTGARTLDALPPGATHVGGGAAPPLATFHLRQAMAARKPGWTVLGA